MHLTLRQIDRFFWFLSQIKALFFYFNRFCVKYLFSSLRACHWLIIGDYFSSIFPMLNPIRKMDFVLKGCHQVVFDWTRAFSYMSWPSNENNLVTKVCLQKKFLTFWDGDKCYFFEISSYTHTLTRTLKKMYPDSKLLKTGIRLYLLK